MAPSSATDPADLGLLEASALLRSRALSAVELLESCQARIAARNGGAPTFDGAPGAINAWARLYPELAAELARAADARLDAQGDAAPVVCGIPLALKDLFAVGGKGLTASSRVLERSVAATDSTVWRRLRGHGMVLAGHSHTHEFAAGGTTDQVGNPWALDRTAGGSSGGSAAALAARMVPAAVGTDTAGSLRIPAALSGVCSIKPTYGRVPDDGCIPLSPTLDHPGPMARSVADASALLAALATDPGGEVDAMIGRLPLAARRAPRPLEGLRVAVTGRPEAADADADVLDGLEAASAAAERLGARIVDLEAPPALAPPDAVTILFHEVWPYHSAHIDRRDRYRPSIREFVDLAEEVHDPAAYDAAQGRRAELTERWHAWFVDHDLDLLLEPTVPMTALARGHGYDSGNLGGEGDPLIVLTSTWNFTGFPVVALPAGLGSRSGLPVGVSLVGLHDAEPLLVQTAIDLQEHELPPLRLGAAD
jgi:aspartyl-tRNA(Asn)/glutamyl-tRNA(Gln) amidotransferase subunit A